MEWEGVPVESTKHTLDVKEAVGGKPLPVSARLVRSLPHPDRTANLWHVRFTPEGKLFTAGYPSGVVQVWDPDSGKELRRVESPRGYRGSANYALTLADFKTLFVPIDGRKAKRVEDDPKKRYKIEYNGEVLVWDLTTGKARPAMKPSKDRGVLSATVSPDGKRLIMVERAGYWAGEESVPDVTRMYDTESDRVWDLGDGYATPAFSPDSKRLYLTLTTYTGKKSSVLKILDTEAKELAVLGKLEDGQAFGTPIVSRDGKRLAVSLSKGRINEPGAIRVYDLTTNKVLTEFGTGGDFPFLMPALSPDGKLIAAGDYDGRLTIWDIDKQALRRRHTFKGMGMGVSLAFDPEGERLAVPVRIKTDADNERDPDPLDLPQPRVYLFDVTTKDDPEEIVCPHGWTGGVAFSHDGKTLAFGGAGAVHLFDMTKKAK